MKNYSIKTKIKNLFKIKYPSSGHKSSGRRNADKSFDRMLFFIPVALLVCAIIVTIAYTVINKTENNKIAVSDDLYNEYANANSFKNNVYGEGQTPNMENTPTPSSEEHAISVYGDSFCISQDVRTPSFAAYLSKYTNMSLVYNVAVAGDTLESMAGREGGLPFYISPCDIPSNKKSVEITLENEYGTDIVPDFSKNGGLNPCKVNGIEGVLSTKNDKLYFTRQESGYELIVSKPTTVETRAMEMRLDDITIFFVGSDDLYKNSARVVDLYTKVTDKLNTDRYLIIGPVTGDKEVIEKVSSALSEKFGNKFFNMYDYLCGDAIKDGNIKLSASDQKLADNKESVPSVFIGKSGNYFSDKANDIIGKKLSVILNELKYL